ncbi:uncharacterized protein LOC100902318 [Galendromus occidentalis]|uniref:Uncharacterized protein LOC100902318 n=1 Tax=Galendromus occidentalis TaxID=34638 RepID=A0AAJ7WJ24_9ACAR|nr:uncharacterized protein LOC100902318 [Galendromus occidentalis]
MEEDKSDSANMEYETVQLEGLELAESNEHHLLVCASDSVLENVDVFHCAECGREYKSRDGLRTHVRKVHTGIKQKASQDQSCLEPNCEASFHTKAELCSHLENHHGLQFEHISVVLPTAPRFYAWMEEFQESSGIRFVRTCGTKQFVKTGTRMHFVCHRSGKCRGKTTSVRMRKERAHGPVKLGIQCVVHLRAVEKPNGSVEVDGCVSHYGHATDEQLMSLLAMHRCRIARFINLGQPAHRVAEMLKQLADPTTPLARIASSDVRNIEQCFGKQFSEVVASYLFEAVGLLLLSNPNVVLVHKPVDSEADGMDPSEFYGVLMTPNQLETFNDYSDSIIAVCMDTVCHFSFSIVTMNCYVRKNDTNFVFPLAWFITSASKPQVYIQTFYYAVVGQTGRFHCNYFFSDDHDEYFVQFIHTFGGDKVPKKQVNLWHMKNMMELALFQHLVEPSKVYNIGCLLDGIFRCPISIAAFSKNLAQIQEVVATDNIPQIFIDYFDTVIVNRTMLWAPCYMGEESAEIHEEFEREHTTMLHFLDHMVMNRWGQKILTSLISYTSPYKIENLELKTEATPEDTDSQQSLETAEAKEYVLKCNEELFTVTNTGKTCDPSCGSRCQCCSLCIHEFTCSSCWQDQPHICEHIHTINDFRKQSNSDAVEVVAEKPPPKPLKERFSQHAEKLELIVAEARHLQMLLEEPETDEIRKLYAQQLQYMQNKLASLSGAALSSVANRTGLTEENLHWMTHNPQIFSIEPKGKLPIMVPREVSIDMVPAGSYVRWLVNVNRHQIPIEDTSDLIRIILSNPGKQTAALLLSNGEKAKMAVLGKRSMDSGEDSGSSGIKSAIFNFQSLLTVILLVICTCAYVRSLYPSLLDKNKQGLRGTFWKFARVGERLSPWVSLACLGMAFCNLFMS